MTQALFSCESDDCSAKTFKKSNRRINRAVSSHDKRSDVRYKFMLEGIRQELYQLQQQNAFLRKIVINSIMPRELAEEILVCAESPKVDIFLGSSILSDRVDECISEDENSTGEAAERTSLQVKDVYNDVRQIEKEKIQRKTIPEPAKFIDRRIMHNDNVVRLADAMSGNYAF